MGAAGRQALLYDAKSGNAFYLRDGRLYNAKGKPAGGITGAVDGWEVRLVSGASKRTLKLRLSEKRKKQ